MRSKVRVAWVSRHPPLKAEIERLKKMFGNVEIVQIRDTFKDAGEVFERVKEAGAEISVVVLPMSMLAQYLPLARKEGIDVWIAKMIGFGEVEGTPKDFNPVSDVLLPMHGSSKSRWMRFDNFERVKEVRVITEPVYIEEMKKARADKGREMEIGL